MTESQAMPNINKTHGWGDALLANVASLIDPEWGGFNVVVDDVERDSKFWPNGDFTRNEYRNTTIYNKQTGTFQTWEVTLPSGPYLWTDLGKIRQFTLKDGPGILKFFGDTVDDYIYVDNDQGNLKELIDIGDVIISNGKTLRIYDIINNKLAVSYPKLQTESEDITALGVTWTVTNGSDIVTTNIPTNWKVGDCIYRVGYGNFIVFEVISSTQFRYVPSINNTTIEARSIFRVPQDQPYKIGQVAYREFNNAGDIVGYKDFFGETVFLTNTLVQGTELTAAEINSSTAQIARSSLLLAGSSAVNNMMAIPTGIETTNPTYFDMQFLRTSGDLVSSNASSSPIDWQGTYTGWGAGLRIRCGHDKTLSSDTISSHLSAIQTRSAVDAGIVSNYSHLYMFPISGTGIIDNLWGLYLDANQYQMNKEAKNFIRGSTLIGSTNAHSRAHATDVTYASITEKLMVKGNITATGTITPGSDIRWKTNIQPISDALNKIGGIRGVFYDWNDEQKESRGTQRQLGLIAQEVEKVFPEAIKEDGDGYKHLNYNGLVGPLVECIKELKCQVDILKTEVQELKSRLI